MDFLALTAGAIAVYMPAQGFSASGCVSAQRQDSTRFAAFALLLAYRAAADHAIAGSRLAYDGCSVYRVFQA